jgi:hypothetical protein
MRIEELDAVCRQAAHDLVERDPRALRPAVVVPLPEATRVLSLPDFPDDDPARFDLMTGLARDVMMPANAPAYGFVAPATVDGEHGPVDVVAVVYGARGHAPRVMAAPLEDAVLGEFTAAEQVDPAAFPFLAPLQHAVDAAAPGQPSGTGSVLPILGNQ